MGTLVEGCPTLQWGKRAAGASSVRNCVRVRVRVRVRVLVLMFAFAFAQRCH